MLNLETISEEIEKIFKDNPKLVEKFGFDEKKEAFIKKTQEEPEKYEEVVKNLNKIFDEADKLIKFSKNISRKKDEIAVSIKNPGQIDTKDFLNRVEDSIRVGLPRESITAANQKEYYQKSVLSSGIRPKLPDEPYPYRNRYFYNYPYNLYRDVVEQRKAELEGILNDDKPLNKGNILDTSYVEKVLLAEAKLEYKLNGFEFKANEFFEKLEIPSHEEVEKHKDKPTILAKVAKNTLESSSKILNAFGKGIISKTKVAETSGYKKQLLERNDLLAGLAARTISNPADGAAHIKHLKALNAALQHSANPEDQEIYAQMERLLNEEMKQIEAKNNQSLTKLQNDLNACNESTLKGLQEHVDKQDEAWKFHLLCAFLAVTPFSPALVFAGPLFNIMGPIAQILGPVLTSGDLAHGIASIVSNPALGPIGDALGAIKLDVGIEWLLNNVPIVSDLTGLADFLIDSPLTQGVIETSSPFFTSALFMTGIAAAACITDGSYTYFRHYDEKEGKAPFLKKQKEALQEITKSCEKNIKDNIETRIQPLAKEKYSIEKTAYINQGLREETALSDDEKKTKSKELERDFILKKALDLELKSKEEIEDLAKKKPDLEALKGNIISREAEIIRLYLYPKGSFELPNPNNVLSPHLLGKLKEDPKAIAAGA